MMTFKMDGGFELIMTEDGHRRIWSLLFALAEDTLGGDGVRTGTAMNEIQSHKVDC